MVEEWMSGGVKPGLRPSKKSVEPELTRSVAGELGRKSGERERAPSEPGLPLASRGETWQCHVGWI